MKKKIAIIGAGFFGLTISLILSKKFQVHIYEKENEILGGASRANPSTSNIDVTKTIKKRACFFSQMLKISEAYGSL